MLVYGQKGPATHVMLHYVYEEIMFVKVIILALVIVNFSLYGRNGPETGLELCFKEVRK